MNQYIITEEQLQRGQEFMSKTGRKKYEKEIRSRLYQSERDKLNELVGFIDANEIIVRDDENEEADYMVFSGEIRAKIEELRQAGEP